MASNKLEGALGIQSNEETSLNSLTSGEDFLEDVEESIAKTNNEVERFISDPRKELSMLESYPNIQIFRKFNTTLPSMDGTVYEKFLSTWWPRLAYRGIIFFVFSAPRQRRPNVGRQPAFHLIHVVWSTLCQRWPDVG